MMENIFHPSLVKRQPLVTRLISNAVGRGKLSHAYLMIGRAAKDKILISRDLACYLNCAHVGSGEFCLLGASFDPDGEPETKSFCQNCRWICQRAHPQAWLVLKGEGNKSGKISVEKARALTDELAKESQYIRVVVIEDSSEEIFHRPAANALLKTIEAPRTACVFMLFAATGEEVLPTVVSRCQVLPLHTTDSLGSSLQANDLSHCPAEAGQICTKVVEKYIHRKEAKTLSALIEFTKELGEMFGDDFTASQAIDMLVGIELEHICHRLTTSSIEAGYAKNLLDLSDRTKQQLDHYVSARAAMETFILSWWRLASAVTESLCTN
jgi:DNA polymerase-3 subunit delta'